MLETLPPNTPIRAAHNREHPLNRGRLGWWLTLPPTEGGRQLYDLMGLYHGTLTNGPTWAGSARPGGWGHVNLDGSNDYINTGITGSPFNFDRTEPFSVACWFRSTSIATTQLLVAKGESSGNFRGWWLGLLSSRVRFSHISTLSNLVDINGGTALASNVWYRLMATYTGSSAASGATLYVNGVAETPTVNNNNLTTATTSAIALQFGVRNATNNPSVGGLDDVSIWGRALSAAEAREDFDLSRAGYPGVLARRRTRVKITTTVGVLSIPVAMASYRRRRA